MGTAYGLCPPYRQAAAISSGGITPPHQGAARSSVGWAKRSVPTRWPAARPPRGHGLRPLPTLPAAATSSGGITPPRQGAARSNVGWAKRSVPTRWPAACPPRGHGLRPLPTLPASCATSSGGITPPRKGAVRSNVGWAKRSVPTRWPAERPPRGHGLRPLPTLPASCSDIIRRDNASAQRRGAVQRRVGKAQRAHAMASRTPARGHGLRPLPTLPASCSDIIR